MHIMGGKTERADAPWSKQKTPCKKIKRKKYKKIFFLLLLLPNLFRGGAHMGKIRLTKKIETEKTEKSQKELLYTTQIAHLYGGSKISRTSNNSNSSNSNSSNNNSNFGGSDLAGPPVYTFFSDLHMTTDFQLQH